MDDQNRKSGQVSGVPQAELTHGKEPGIFAVSRGPLPLSQGSYGEWPQLRASAGKQKSAEERS